MTHPASGVIPNTSATMPVQPQKPDADHTDKRPKTRTAVQSILLNLGLLTAGSALYIVGMNGILVPNHFLSGGVTGICLIIHYLFPVASIGVLYTLLNIPLFLLGWFQVSRKFVWYTAFGIIVFSVLTDAMAVPPVPLQNPVLAAILAGIVCGIGGGLILRSAGTAGGLDVLSIYLYKRFELRLGWSSFLLNALILGAAAFFFNLEMALYTAIFVFTQGRLIDKVTTGFNQRKLIFIISDKSHEISDRILNQLHRGVTFLEGQGAYTGQRTQVALSVTTLTELARMKRLIFDVDPDAFVVINDTMEVLGNRHGQRRVF